MSPRRHAGIAAEGLRPRAGLAGRCWRLLSRRVATSAAARPWPQQRTRATGQWGRPSRAAWAPDPLTGPETREMIQLAMRTRSTGTDALLGVITLGLALCLPACAGDRVTQLERDVQELRTEVQALQRSRAEHRTRVAELSGRLLSLQDRMESELALRRRMSRAPADLPVIRLGTEAPSEGSYSIIGSGPAAPAEPAALARRSEPAPQRRAAPSPERRFSPATAERRGIERSDRLSVEPLPPPPSAAAAAPPAPAAPAPAPLPVVEARASLPAVAEPSEGPLPEPSRDPKQEYERAFRSLQEGKSDLSRRLFERFVQLHPDHELTDNAVYWAGEVRYKEKAYPKALELFSQVVERFPTGNKVPDAFLKIGLCYLNLGKPDAARKILEQVRSIFPETRAAEIAVAHLKTL